MRSTRLAFAIIALLALIWAPVSASDQVIEPHHLSGIAHDGLGNLLANVEVLLLQNLVDAVPAATARTDEKGRFRVAGLAPGLYRVAAIKRGYRTYLGKIDTLVHSSIDLLMRPAETSEAAQEGKLPRDASWALRLPRRSILRELEAAADGTVEPAAGQPMFLASVAREIDLRLDHSFSLANGGGIEANSSSLRGSETAMRLSSSLGERGNISLSGYRERLQGEGEGSIGDIASRQNSSLRLDLSYDTSADAALAVKAFYNSGGLERLDPSLSSAQSRRSWGYDAAWSKQISAASRVSVRMDYENHSMAMGSLTAGVEDPGIVTPGLPFEPALLNRRMGAEGVYESAPAKRHQVKVGLRAEFEELPLSAVRPLTDSVVPASAGWVDGWSLGLNAEDNWSVSGPLTLIAGVGYRQALVADRRSLLVPRVGAAWNEEWVQLRLLLSYHAGSSEASIDEVADSDLRPVFEVAEPLGYQGDLVVPLTRATRLKGAFSFQPTQLDTAGGNLSAVQPIFLSNGDASSRRAGIGIEHDWTTTRASFEFARGEATGTLKALSAFAAPFQILGDNALDFTNGSLAIQVVPSGTDVVLEYRKVSERSLEAIQDLALVEESLEFRLVQSLLRLSERGGSWRLLVAARAATLDAPEEPVEVEQVLTSANHQVSAGVSVIF